MRVLQHELRQVDSLLVQISSGQTSIGRFLTGDREYSQLLQLVDSFERSMRSFLGTGDPLREALFSSALYDRIRAPLLRVDRQLAAIQRGEGKTGQFFASDRQYEDFLRDLRDLRSKLANPDPALLRDESGYRKIQKMLAATDAMISELSAGRGEMGHLLRDPELYESLNGSLRGIRELLEDVRQNPRKYLRYKLF